MIDQAQAAPTLFPYPSGWGEELERKETPPEGKEGATVAPSEEGVTALHVGGQPQLGGFKKIISVLLILIVLAAAGFGIYKFVLPRFQKPQAVTLSYWGLWEPGEVMKEVLDEWERDHPSIKVDYTQHSHREYRERLQSALARNEGPDIFRFHISWLPMFKNELEPIPVSVMSATQYESTYYPVVTTNLRSGGGYLGVPLGIDTLALFYNKEIFQAAGKVPPTTWDELRKLAIELTTEDQAGHIQTAGVALGTTSNVEHWPDILGLMMLQNGADLTNPADSLAQDALTFYTIFTQTDRVWDATLPVSTFAFATGKTAMYFGFSWDVFEIQNINSNLSFDIVPVPQLPGADLAWASFWVEGVAEKSEHKEAAWEFLKFLSSAETMEKLYQAEAKIRLFGEPYARVEMASKLTADPMVAPFIDQAAKAQTWYLCSRTWDNGINDRMIKYFEDAVNAVHGTTSAEEALQTTAGGVSQLLSQYGIASVVTR